MTSEQVAAIERLRELEKKATPGEWWVDESGEICTAVPLDKNNQVDKQNIVNQAFICALRNKAFPLLQEMQAEIEYLKSEDQRTDRAFSKALKDLVLAKRESKRFGNQMVLAVNKNCELQAENERMRAGIKDVAAKFAEMTDLRDHYYYEMETAQTETVFAKKEIERLRAGIGRALGELEAGKPGDAESILEALHDA